MVWVTSIWDTVVRVHWVGAVTVAPIASTALVEVSSAEEVTSEVSDEVIATDIGARVTVRVDEVTWGGGNSVDGMASQDEDSDEERVTDVGAAVTVLVDETTWGLSVNGMASQVEDSDEERATDIGVRVTVLVDETTSEDSVDVTMSEDSDV